jgi:hypothetical protein
MACRNCSAAEKCVQVFGGIAWDKGLFGRTRFEWENNMNSLLKSGGYMEWISLTKDRDM